MFVGNFLSDGFRKFVAHSLEIAYRNGLSEQIVS